MKKILIAFTATFSFGYATAQVEPATSQKKTTDTVVIAAPQSDDDIANKGILHRNTIESGGGKPDNIKRKINKRTKPTDPQIIPRIKTDTTTPKPQKLQRRY